MPVKLLTGNMLASPAQALVNTVNTVGVMGKGIAKQFRDAYPSMYRSYVAACKAQEFFTGQVLVLEDHDLRGPRTIINFPTKKHWRQPSTYAYVETGLVALRAELIARRIESVAIPPLGCGNGGLDWSRVRPMIEASLQDLDIAIDLYEPNATVRKKLRREVPRVKGKLTDARAMLLQAMFEYEDAEFETASPFVANKLAYFIQRLGEDLRLRFKGHYYGPYDQAVTHVLAHVNGSYVRGFEQGAPDPFDDIELLYDRRSEVGAYLKANTTSEQRAIMQSLRDLLQGFNSAFALEVLSTVDYVRQETKADTVEEVRERLGEWSARKLELMRPQYIETALTRLRAFDEVLV